MKMEYMNYYTANEKFVENMHNGYITDAKKLMEHEQFNPNYENENAITHLQSAAEVDNIEMLDALYAKGADPSKDIDALNTAAAWNHPNSIEWLVDHGADVHLNNEDALRTAVHYDKREAAEMLINKGADVEVAIPQIKNIKEETAQWLRSTANSVKLANKLDTTLAQKDNYEDMMKKLGLQHKAKQEQSQSITRAGKIKV
ncbi:ankyrin repeat domain-containing protein [Burkholderia contaminans]|uniref:ankyrin repeat domain-containing protein n=1 Tax=Burkholderia contaminans TaxID=488447 RepID=UPI0018DCCE9B|nr:ankyrin repeat domain-containing protein [Burkholderia contaminans]MBH9720531.1 ankyrin repeat domain-containing protein [Burkholderia contaminans]